MCSVHKSHIVICNFSFSFLIFPVLHTFLFYYGKGENATFSTTATSNIYPKNNSVQNRSVSELKKKTKNKTKTKKEKKKNFT